MQKYIFIYLFCIFVRPYLEKKKTIFLEIKLSKTRVKAVFHNSYGKDPYKCPDMVHLS
jgi:hypothetical protein